MKSFGKQRQNGGVIHCIRRNMQFPLPTFCSRVYFYSWPLLMPTFFEYCDESETSNPAGSSYHLVLRPPPHIEIARVQESSRSSFLSFRLPAHKFHRYSTFRRAHQRNSLWNSRPSLLVLVNARGRPLKMKITEREISSRISPTNPRYRCSLIFLPFLSLFSFSTFKDCDCVRGSSWSEQRVLHATVYFSWQMFRWNYVAMVEKREFALRNLFQFSLHPREILFYIYIYIWLGGEIKTRVFNLIIAFTKRKFEEDKPLNYYIEETNVG